MADGDDDAQIPEQIQAMSFEEALEALEEIVQRLDSGQVSLEDSIDIYTRGTHPSAIVRPSCGLPRSESTKSLWAPVAQSGLNRRISTEIGG